MLKEFTKKRLSFESYTSIEDLPISIWWKIHETGELMRLIKGDYKPNKKTFLKCEEIWDVIKQEHIDKFGLDFDFLQYLEAQSDLLDLQLEYAITQNRMTKTLMILAQNEFDTKYKVKKTNEFKIKARIEQYLGVSILPNVCTVVEYYSYIELVQDMSREKKG